MCESCSQCVRVGSPAYQHKLQLPSQEHGNSCTGELYQPNSGCFGRSLATYSFGHGTVSREHKIHKPNSRIKLGLFIQRIARVVMDVHWMIWS